MRLNEDCKCSLFKILSCEIYTFYISLGIILVFMNEKLEWKKLEKGQFICERIAMNSWTEVKSQLFCTIFYPHLKTLELPLCYMLAYHNICILSMLGTPTKFKLITFLPSLSCLTSLLLLLFPIKPFCCRENKQHSHNIIDWQRYPDKV